MSTFVVEGARVLGTSAAPDGDELDVVVVDGVVSAMGPPGLAAFGAAASEAAGSVGGAPRIDGRGLFVAPGYVDLQLNGAAGHDLTASPERLPDVAAALPLHGVTAFLPTVVTAPDHQRAVAIAALGRPGPLPAGAAAPLGVHLEGPALAPGRRGAHAEAHLRLPDASLLEGWGPEAGVRLVTLAPELAGGLDAVRTLAARGVVVSAGHTAASAAELSAAVDAGVRMVTHLFNAMPPLGHRAPGPVGVALTDRRVVCGLIADGIHVDPLAVQVAWASLGRHRLVLVSDAVAALGMPPGTHHLGVATVTLDAAGSVRLADGTLAGTACGLATGVRNLWRWTGCSRADAVATATCTPAALLGSSTRAPALGSSGVLSPGGPADLVLLTPDLHVLATFVGGVVAHGSEDVPWRS